MRGACKAGAPSPRPPRKIIRPQGIVKARYLNNRLGERRGAMESARRDDLVKDGGPENSVRADRKWPANPSEERLRRFLSGSLTKLHFQTAW